MATKCYQGVALIITAMLVVFCEAQQNAMQQGYYYQGARIQRPDVMQQGYYYQSRDAQIQQLAQRPSVMGQGYYYRDGQNQQLVQEPSVIGQVYYYQDSQNQQLMQEPSAMGQGYYYQEANQQQGPEAKQQSLSCLLQIESPSKNVTLCIQADRICTLNASVPACSSSATGCKAIGGSNMLIKNFISQHPEVYADECLDTSGAWCFFTDVKYHSTCSTVNTSGRTSFCVMLSDGTERCSNLVDLIPAVKTTAAKEEVSAAILPFKPEA